MLDVQMTISIYRLSDQSHPDVLLALWVYTRLSA